VTVRLEDTRHFAVVPSAIAKYMCVLFIVLWYNGKNKSFD